MASKEKSPTADKKLKEWTLMFYFASDNPLAPGVVSQLKAIKQAGFHHGVNVVAQFDPQTEGTPTHVFDVNHVHKLIHDEPRIGYIGHDPSSPFVRNLIEDRLWLNEKDRNEKPIRNRLRKSMERRYEVAYNPPKPPDYMGTAADDGAAGGGADDGAGADADNGADRRGGLKSADKDDPRHELGPQRSLREFLKFCRRSYPARHYMLFILGHGVVVGNDVFLYDANADRQTLSLVELADELREFKGKLPKGSEFELVSFHSCSVSSLEVAYQLRPTPLRGKAGQLCGTANYMLASQGTAFIGSWPYRQILMRVFKDTEARRKKTPDGDEYEPFSRAAVKEMLLKIFHYCIHNSTDFLVAGYSFHLSLCSLTKADDIKLLLDTLSTKLKDALADPLLRDFILLAHWHAQSFWQETYTDLRDFCLCLIRQCREFERKFVEPFRAKKEAAAAEVGKAIGELAEAVLGKTPDTLQAVIDACQDVAGLLETEHRGKGRRAGESEGAEEQDSLVIASQFAGPDLQYSNGLSVYFPWSQPLGDNPMWRQYRKYAFKDTGWVGFLEGYFRETCRAPRQAENEYMTPAPAQNGAGATRATRRSRAQQFAEDDARLSEDLISLAFIDGGRLSGEEALADKVSPRDPLGDDCGCGSVKNYPRDTRPLSRRLTFAMPRPADEKDDTCPSILSEEQEPLILDNTSSAE